MDDDPGSAPDPTPDTPAAAAAAEDGPTLRDLLNRINESHEAINARIDQLSERIPEAAPPAEAEVPEPKPETTTVEPLPDTTKTRKPHKRRGMIY